MPFPSALSAGQYTTLRTSGYWQRTIACLNPTEVVFRAQASESIADAPFITFTWDNADTGAYTSVLQGMVVYLSSTTSIRDAYYRGRVRLAPSATEFYIDENASILTDNDYVIVTRDADLAARIRRDTLVDGSVTYHNLPPMIEGLPSTLCLYDANNDGVVTYAATQTGVAVASGATISSWLWTISGAGATSFTVGTSTSQNPTIQFEAGYHYLVRCRVTDSNGVQMFQFIQVYAVNRTFTAPANTSLVTGSVNADMEAGYTASITAYADVSTLVDRTHCAVFSVEHFGDDSSTPIVTNVLMNGRIRSDSIQTQGTEEAGQVQQVSFAVEGITAYLQRLRLPNDIIRASAAPDEWGEITNPNPFRMAVYAMWVYTTLPNVCSFSAESGNFDAWRIGAEPMSIDGGFATDVLNSILWERIKAQPNYAPSGEILLARNVNYLTDRSGVVTVADFALTDILELTIDRDSSKVTAQVIGYGGVFNSTLNTWTIYTAQSPSIVYGDAPETREITREILEYDSTVAEAAAELSGRASNDYAFNNPKPLNNVTFYDSMAWLIPTGYQRYTFTIPASANTLGIAYTTADYWQCQSVSLTLNADGSVDVSAEFPGETEFDDAQAVAALLPNNLENLNPVLPVLPNDPAFPTDPLEIYPNDDPGLDDLQPIGNFSLGQTQTPFPPDIAADMTERQSEPGCNSLAVNFRNSSNTISTKVTTLGAGYTITLNGFSTYSTDGWQQSFDFTASDGGFSAYVQPPSETRAVYSPGVGWVRGGSGSATQMAIVQIQYLALPTFTLNSATIYTSIAPVSNGYQFRMPDVAGADYASGFVGNGALSVSITINTTSDGIWISVSNANGVNYLGAITRLELRGEGANPFTGTSGAALSCDAFYTFDPADAEVTAQLYGASEGLRIQNAAVTPADIPPFAANHLYTIPYTGDGNLTQMRMQFDDYAEKQNRNLQVQICRIG